MANRTVAQWLLSICLPQRIKRMVVCAGFYSYVHKDDSPERLERGLKGINEGLDLSEHVEPLMYVAHLPLKYWDNFSVAEVSCGIVDYDSAVNNAVNKVPFHLRYASSDEMATDLRKIIVLLPVSAQTKVVQMYKR